MNDPTVEELSGTAPDLAAMLAEAGFTETASPPSRKAAN